ncbi:lantibiotic dehydratase [Streptomyces iconiensis]|uniref:Lantibiotic dehydratase n=1 Tax=Streptomyces iconiensis TaxID=1384038 RepID=A0ABT7A4R9_9ACTN|nr:lantibiotic dehydratase [Streptomyces iconiensis]MDJ1136276.1 lantibiotic dehydratase [Streptomyces iconiensis]
MRREVQYQCSDTALVRAARYARLELPPLPDVSGDSSDQVRHWHRWLQEVWGREEISEVVEQASPGFARHLDALCASTDLRARQVRRTLVSFVRYLQRITGRATPNGLFAGIAPVAFGQSGEVRTGPWHRAVASADATWLTEVIERLERCPDLMRRLPVVASNTPFVRGDRLIVPYPPRSRGRGRPTAEVSLRFTSAVQAALDSARAPVPYELLVDKVQAAFPHVPAGRIRGLITNLVLNGALINSLHAASATLDPLDHLVRQLEAVDAGELRSVADMVDDLRAVRDGVRQHNQALAPADGRRLRRALHEKMTAVAVADRPLAVDLRLDCSLVLPREIAREAEKAATALARLTPAPFGTPGWKDFHVRFFERYGIGSLVRLRDVTDPDVGLGFPAGYLDSDSEPREGVTMRDQRLLALAQAAALDGREEILLDEELLTELHVGEQDDMQVPPHLELNLQIEAATVDDLCRGDFTLWSVHPSRGIGTITGRFLTLLPPEARAAATASVAQIPANTPGAVPVQLSFPPLNREDATVIRVPELLPSVLSVAEHRSSDERTIDLDDLVVGCDRRRLYLASLSRQRLVEPHVLHALDLRAHTPPLVRFLAEISRAQSAVVTEFAWGVATALPYLPRVRYGRTVLAPARWRLDASDLPGLPASWTEWHAAVKEWRARRRVPETLALAEGDQFLPLHLETSAHRAILRSHLSRSETAVLTETSTNGNWFDGRAHEIVLPMTAARPAQWPAVPPVTEDRVLSRDHGHLPGARGWLLAQIYGHPERQAEILSRHLPDLLARWKTPPQWWFMRYRDPHPHLRLRIAVPDDADAGAAAAHVSEWAAGLRRAGLVSDLKFATTYPETGRWGTGPLMGLAEDVFAADSRTLAVQLAQTWRPGPQVMAAANFVSITTAFTGSVPGAMEWLTRYGQIRDPRPCDRQVLNDTIRLADPADDWAALRSHIGGEAIAAAWADRDQAIARYRSRLSNAALDPDLVLDSLLHAHHIRAVGIDKADERMCVRLARAAARAWQHRGGHDHGTA